MLTSLLALPDPPTVVVVAAGHREEGEREEGEQERALRSGGAVGGK